MTIKVIGESAIEIGGVLYWPKRNKSEEIPDEFSDQVKIYKGSGDVKILKKSDSIKSEPIESEPIVDIIDNQCQHIKSSGERCKGKIIRVGESYCFVHNK